ncbi:MerR family transcriptional regulator [Lactiplantibacillus garii]|uniref:MerR family transcriptional regulator n=1 Tax=Lactiplantibacillus garii TaxID=2306423 RepID=A0A426DAM7_9LACO|nr:MerR family transcriptional regulator [Lactiplantibacillus garii]RRK11669.1 MerR family transcriptional regulator [Lactiplantibacillus garii]
MDNQDAAFFKKFKAQIHKHQFTIGISDLAKMTGVSQTQLRYWEQKNYIHSIKMTEKNTVHRYTYGTLMRVHFIKTMLDEGFTLAAATQRAEEHGLQMEMMRVFVMSAFQGIEERDGHHMINLGYFDEDHRQELYCYIKDNQPHYRVYPVK